MPEHQYLDLFLKEEDRMAKERFHSFVDKELLFTVPYETGPPKYRMKISENWSGRGFYCRNIRRLHPGFTKLSIKRLTSILRLPRKYSLPLRHPSNERVDCVANAYQGSLT